ncbi:MAG: metal-dependent transcriptional regulator [Desulfurococcales archaeon]|jgi:DtxR family Mn-dependent transcriptional regulator|nr:metal-dependent transcriptional regulator [Desulfurococcales archaeon]
MARKSEGRLSERALDYLLVIYILSQGKGFARLTDISKYMGISPPSAHEYISYLIKIGYVSKNGRGAYKLTETGIEILSRRIHAHGVLEEMLVRIFRIDINVACSIASAIDSKIDWKELEKICSMLGHPATCPHGMMLPHEKGALPLVDGKICIGVKKG